MREELLHYLWKTKNFRLKNLSTTQNKSIIIENFGTHNHDAGPDFLNAQVHIDGILWSGHIEIHIKASDWNLHQHNNDPVYDNVILHVVFDFDMPIYRMDHSLIPCLSLAKRIEKRTIQKFHKLSTKDSWIPCEDLIDENIIQGIEVAQFLDATLIERLETKTQFLQNRLIENKGDWNQSFFELLTRYLGNKVNNEAMEMLAKEIGYLNTQKVKSNRLDLEALFFGVAGFLSNHYDDHYSKDLRDRYLFLKEKYQLNEMKKEVWKFSRMRPSAFPSIRIAQLVAILFHTDQLFSKIQTCLHPNQLYNMFRVPVSLYWDTHYTFGKPSTARKKKLGKTAVDLLIVNAIVPALFLYGKEHYQEEMQKRALGLLEQVKAEHNQITRNFKSMGFSNNSAYHSQSLLQLKTNYCNKSKCLSCAIGHKLMS